MSSTSLFVAGPAGQLETRVVSPDNALITALICHPHPLFGGSMTNKVVTTVAKTLQNRNYRTVIFNFRGVGQSQGEFANAIGEVEDLRAIYDWARQQWPETEFMLAGFSFGAYIAARGSEFIAAKQLTSIAPAVTHYDFTLIKRPACPWLIIQPEQDEVVPPEKVYQFAEQVVPRPTLVRIPEAGHFFHSKLSLLQTTLDQHLSTEGLP